MNFLELYNQYKDIVFNLALQYIQNTEDAEEITQDVFLSIYEKLSEFRKDSKLSTWIYRITINKSLDYIKAKKRMKRLAFFTSLYHDKTGELKSEFSDFNHPGVLMEQREALEKIFRTINELPDRQKTLIILMKIEGKTEKEVANIMCISIKAVESLFQRAKSKLSEKLNL